MAQPPAERTVKERAYLQQARPSNTKYFNQYSQGELLNQNFLATDDVHTLLYAAQALTLQVVDSIVFLQ